MVDVSRVTVELPRLVSDLTGAPHRLEVDADDARGALDALVAAHPGVRGHLLDEAGALRTNVLCAVDGEPTRLTGPVPVTDGSRVRFVGSVAGG